MRVFALALLLTAGSAFAAPPILSQNFEQDDTGWMVAGGDGKLHVTHDASLVKNGRGAMEFRYEASGTKPALALTPVTKSIAGMKSLSLWSRADSQTAAAVVLVEKNGGRYAANFWLEANSWQRVELTPEDFVLATGENDPKDPDGKLDLDQIEAIGLIDVSQILAAAVIASQAPIAVKQHSGAHRMWADDFEIGSDSPAWNGPRPAFLIDDFRAPQVNWISAGGANLKIDSESLRIEASEVPDNFVMVSRMLPVADLSGASHIALDIATDYPAHLLIFLQEKSAAGEGPRYQAAFEVPGGNRMEHREIALPDFEFDNQGPADPNHKLDLDKLKLLSIVDVTGAYVEEEGVNTIRIGKIVAVTRK